MTCYPQVDAQLARIQTLLAKNPKDRDALFAMTLSSGLRADYAALIEKIVRAARADHADEDSMVDRIGRHGVDAVVVPRGER